MDFNKNKQKQMIRISKQILIVLGIALLMAVPAKAQNNPYVDDKLLHFGFSLGVDYRIAYKKLIV